MITVSLQNHTEQAKNKVSMRLNKRTQNYANKHRNVFRRNMSVACQQIYKLQIYQTNLYIFLRRNSTTTKTKNHVKSSSIFAKKKLSTLIDFSHNFTKTDSVLANLQCTLSSYASHDKIDSSQLENSLASDMVVFLRVHFHLESSIQKQLVINEAFENP